ncbi:MAG: hypothetical protein RL701_435 [Pseudomonadota bacterium]
MAEIQALAAPDGSICARHYATPQLGGDQIATRRAAIAAVSIALFALALNIALLVRRGQTIGLWLCGAQVRSPDGSSVGAWRLVLGRQFLPLLAFTLAGSVPLGIPPLVAANCICMCIYPGQTLVDTLTRTVVTKIMT